MNKFDDHHIFKQAKQVLMAFYDAFQKPSSSDCLKEDDIIKLVPDISEGSVNLSMTLLLEKNLIHIEEVTKYEPQSIPEIKGFKITQVGIDFIDSNRDF